MTSKPHILRRCSSSFSYENQIPEMPSGPTSNLVARMQKEKFYQKVSLRDRFRIEQEKWWINRILESCHNDEDVAFVVIMECLRWRVAFDVECIGLLSLKDLLDRQLIFIHGKDLNNTDIMWINLRHYSAGENRFKQLFAFWLERHYMDTKGEPMTIFFDMTDCKDMDIFKFMLKLIKYYYPSSVRDILVYNSPSILNAPWKVILSWLEEGHPGIQQIERDNVIDCIHPDHLPPELGGDDPFVFSMAEVAKCLPTPPTDDDGFVDSTYDHKGNMDDFNRRSVTFDDPENPGRREPLTLARRPPSRGSSVRRNGGLSSMVKSIVDRRLQAQEWYSSNGIYFNPCEEVTLQKVEGEHDLVDVIVVKNGSTKPWMFKIKTTSPEKFRVRPSAGVVLPNATEIVRVYLQNGVTYEMDSEPISEYKYSCNKEKFLVMALETTEVQTDKFSELWKNPNSTKVEHKLKCRVLDNGAEDNRPERKSSLLSTQQNQIEELQKEIRQLANTQRLIIIVLAFLFAILFISMLYERSNYDSLRSSIDILTSSQIRTASEGTNQERNDEL